MGLADIQGMVDAKRPVVGATLAWLISSNRVSRTGTGRVGDPWQFFVKGKAPRRPRRQKGTVDVEVAVKIIAQKFEELTRLMRMILPSPPPPPQPQLYHHQPPPQPVYYEPAPQYYAPPYAPPAPPAPPPPPVPTVLSPPRPQPPPQIAPGVYQAPPQPPPGYYRPAQVPACQLCGLPPSQRLPGGRLPNGMVVCENHLQYGAHEAAEENLARRLLPGLR